jgi:predicted MFS family arabinose efflux permease
MPLRTTFGNRWWVVFGSTLGLLVGSGPVLLFTFGVFLKPVAGAFGWNRGTVASALAVSHTLGAIATLFVGRLIDRFGIRRVTLPFIAVFSLTVAAISRTPAYPAVFLLLYAVAGLVGSVQAPLPYAKAISAWFDSQRGLALGIAMAGVGLGGALMPQLARLLIGIFGWRGAYVGLGIVTFAVAFPAVALFLREPGTLANGQGRRSANGETHRIAFGLPGLSASEVLTSSSRFWFILVAVFLVATAVNGTIAHIVPLLTDRGVSSEFATLMLTASSLALIVGRILSGYLLDWFFAPYVAVCFFLLPLIGIALLSAGSGGAVALIAAVCLGLGIGSELNVTAFLVGRYFGLRTFGEVYGYLTAVFLFGSGLGPWVMAACFDRTHSYNLALAGFSLALVVASLFISRLGPYAYPESGVHGQPDAPPATAAIP